VFAVAATSAESEERSEQWGEDRRKREMWRGSGVWGGVGLLRVRRRAGEVKSDSGVGQVSGRCGAGVRRGGKGVSNNNEASLDGRLTRWCTPAPPPLLLSYTFPNRGGVAPLKIFLYDLRVQISY
jgi:hypothetical protein